MRIAQIAPLWECLPPPAYGYRVYTSLDRSETSRGYW
jgi:hypothetical protein